ncbi:MAG: Gfo/Idh/MocA family oxidoreductase [Cyclobacteriaceae bacterium]
MKESIEKVQTLRPIVIIGAGGIVGDAHLPAYKKAGFDVQGIYDLNAQKATTLANKFGISVVCNKLDDLIGLAVKKQCVFDMALPASAILPVLNQLPDESGVLIQKPMGDDLSQAKEILALCRTKNLVAGINFQLRHAPYIVEARKIIDEGLIGDLHDIDIRVNVLTPWHLWEFLYKLPRMEILYNSIHYIDLIRYFFGNPERVFALTNKHPKMKELASTRSSIIMDYGDMIRANINTNHGHEFGTKHQESYVKFEGTKGAIKLTMGLNLNYPEGRPDEFEYICLEDGKGWRKKEIRGSWFPDAFIGPMAGLLHKMENPSYRFVNAVEDAIHTMEVVEKCYQCSDGR